MTKENAVKNDVNVVKASGVVVNPPTSESYSKMIQNINAQPSENEKVQNS